MKKVLISLICALCFSLSLSGESKNLKQEKKIIYEVLSTQYAGFEDSKQNGFSKSKLNAAKDFEQLKEVLEKYIYDWHLQIKVDETFVYLRKFDSDTTNKSIDPDNTFECKETSNAFYVRCNNCTDSNVDYEKLGIMSYRALLFDYIILDFRSNFGGSDAPLITFFGVLASCKYEGTLIILQDRWSFSAGEVYGTGNWLCSESALGDQKVILVGTNSGGAQLYGNCQLITKDNVKFWLPTTEMKHIKSIPNYEGDGKGYRPDIYATKENLKAAIENLGVDLTGIEFR